ncbi:MAG TPA: DNA gyrase C-terminal beta-propeller domain-containing protein [Anaerolineaceae bacterium]|nr:DNA gyrase C-terminal beta-propeller domain-containing protein [Anaerolineaceae bacterium]
MQRPDLTGIDPTVIAYIEYLENELGRKASYEKRPADLADETPVIEPTEAPTTFSLITISASGMAKRSPRHLYARQHRAGMGIFDLEVPESDPPAFLAVADENQSLILFTNFARAFRYPLNKLEPAEIRSKGEWILDRLPLEPEERLATVLPDQASGYIALVSQKGMVRSLRHHLFGEFLRPGTSFYNFRDFGPLAAACWTPGDGDLFITTRQGMAIRFSEKLVPPQGTLGIRVGSSDSVAGVAPVRDDSGVFLLSADGKGTIRQMSGFNPNKSTGGSGKIAIKSDELVGCTTVTPQDDLFIISSLGKLIRFRADEVPETEGVVQGVHCINLRADRAVALTKSSPVNPLNFRSS